MYTKYMYFKSFRVSCDLFFWLQHGKTSNIFILFCRSELFQVQAKLDVFKKKEEDWHKCQSELESLKIKFLLQGELGEISQNFYAIILFHNNLFLIV